jgi:hypothetical protein
LGSSPPQEVGHPRGVHVGVLLNLPHQMRLIVEASPADVPPILVKVRTVVVQHGRDLVVVVNHCRKQLSHDPVIFLLSLGGEEGGGAALLVSMQLGPHVVEDVTATLLGLDEIPHLV